MKNNSVAIKALIELLRKFISGENCSVGLVNQVEALLIEHFYDDKDDEIKGLLIAAASYQPEGGDNLYDKQTFVSPCKEALFVLEGRLKNI